MQNVHEEAPRREQFVFGGPSLAMEFARLRKKMLNN